MLFAVKSPVDFFPQSFFFGGIVGIGHALGKSGQFFARLLALARQFKSKVKHPRLFSARQLFDFFNDGGGGHGLIIAQIKFQTRENVIPNRGQLTNDAIETLNSDRMNRIYRMEKFRGATAKERHLLVVAF
jgi:hypothetical protein